MNIKTVACRFDVNNFIGHGHFVRCNEIAYQLQKMQCRVIAITDKRSLFPLDVKETYFDKVFLLSHETDVQQTVEICEENEVTDLLIDHYHCDEIYQKYLLDRQISWGQFDFKRNGSYFGKYIINVNLSVKKSWYDHCYLAKTTELLLGSDYAVIKHQLLQKMANDSLHFNGQVFFSLGGGDDHGLYEVLTPLLLSFKEISNLHICCSSHCESAPYLRAFAQLEKRLVLHLDLDSLLPVMQHCRYGVISGGTLTYELATLGIPFACGYLADNQIELCKSWQEQEQMTYLGDLKDIRLVSQLNQIIQQMKQSNYAGLSLQLREKHDGLGAFRIAQHLVSE